MKFKMAAAAILNLLFLSTLVKWSISGGSRLVLIPKHYFLSSRPQKALPYAETRFEP